MKYAATKRRGAACFAYNVLGRTWVADELVSRCCFKQYPFIETMKDETQIDQSNEKASH